MLLAELAQLRFYPSIQDKRSLKMGTIPIGNPKVFFFVPCSWHTECYIFQISCPRLNLTIFLLDHHTLSTSQILAVWRTCVTTNAVNTALPITSLPEAQWLEHATSVLQVTGLIPIGDSNFFFVPHLSDSEYLLHLSFFFSELKIHHLSFSIIYWAADTVGNSLR